MKITRQEIRRIIREEINNVVREKKASQVDEGVGTTSALLMGLWTGVSGDNNSLQVIDLDGNTHKITQQEFEGAAGILDKVSDTAYGDGVTQAVGIFDIENPDNTISYFNSDGALDLRNIPNSYGKYSAGPLLNQVLDTVDKTPSPSAEQPEISRSSHTVNTDAQLEMIQSIEQSDPQSAQTRAQKILDDNPAGMSPETKAELQRIASLN